MCGLGSNLSLDAQALSYNKYSAVEDLSEVAARFFLDQDRGDQDPQVEGWISLQELQQCITQRQTEILLLEDFTEL